MAFCAIRESRGIPLSQKLGAAFTEGHKSQQYKSIDKNIFFLISLVWFLVPLTNPLVIINMIGGYVKPFFKFHYTNLLIWNKAT